MLLPTLIKIGIVLDFKINQDFIAEMLCINRDEPMTTCNGTCYLTQQLQKAEEQEDKQAPLRNKEPLQVAYYYDKSDFAFDFDPIDWESKTQPTSRDLSYHSSFHAAIFHPPKMLFDLV